jgi:CheY-like chemotaxis protein
VTATNGARGLVCAAQHHPDAIILDLLMPISNGNWFCRAYSGQPGRHAPIIVVSARPVIPGVQIENAVAYLRKPFELDELPNLLHGLNKAN